MEAMVAGVATDPLCALCGEPVPDEEISMDHIIPFNGVDDPLRLRRSNLRITHKRCHMQHTGQNSNEADTWAR